jgi:hypothetical protein
VSARKADAVGNGTAAGRGNSGPIATASDPHPAILTNLLMFAIQAPTTRFLIALSAFFRFLAKNRHKCLSINNLSTKSRFFHSTPIKPNQAQSCLIVPFFCTAATKNPPLPYLTILVRIDPSGEDETGWGLSIESANHRPGNGRQPQGLHKWHFERSCA